MTEIIHDRTTMWEVKKKDHEAPSLDLEVERKEAFEKISVILFLLGPDSD